MYETIMGRFQQRKTRAQKTAFIEMMQARYPELKVEDNGKIGGRNLIVGEPESAKIVFTAHYDTVSVNPIPNIITPDRPWIRYMISLLGIFPMVVVMVLVKLGMLKLGAAELLANIVMLAVYFGMFAAFFFGGKPSPNTANDNTSGVLALCRLMERLPRDGKAAFVFFDNEEYGCLGSKAFYKKHKREMQDKLIFNLDCVGDGDTILLVLSKKALPGYEELVRKAFTETDGFKTRVTSAKKVNYTSDQKHFPLSVAVAAMNSRKWLGLYLDKIHTKKDTVCRVENLDYICKCAAELAEHI